MNTFLESARGAAYYTQPDEIERPARTDFQSSEILSNSGNDRGWDQTIDELLRIRKLPDDWDGEGSSAPEVIIVDSAITFAQYFSKQMPSPQRVHVGVNGTIYFEWYSHEGYREIEVFALNRAESRSFPMVGSRQS